jgi:hypothetical protein
MPQTVRRRAAALTQDPKAGRRIAPRSSERFRQMGTERLSYLSAQPGPESCGGRLTDNRAEDKELKGQIDEQLQAMRRPRALT